MMLIRVFLGKEVVFKFEIFFNRHFLGGQRFRTINRQTMRAQEWQLYVISFWVFLTAREEMNDLAKFTSF